MLPFVLLPRQECWTDSELLQSCDTQLPPSGGSSPPTEIKLTGAVVGASKSPTCVSRQIYTGFVKERILGRRPVMDRQENSGAAQCENVVAAEVISAYKQPCSLAVQPTHLMLSRPSQHHHPTYTLKTTSRFDSTAS